MQPYEYSISTGCQQSSTCHTAYYGYHWRNVIPGTAVPSRSCLPEEAQLVIGCLGWKSNKNILVADFYGRSTSICPNFKLLRNQALILTCACFVHTCCYMMLHLPNGMQTCNRLLEALPTAVRVDYSHIPVAFDSEPPCHRVIKSRAVLVAPPRPPNRAIMRSSSHC